MKTFAKFLCAAALALPLIASAQTKWPERPVRIIVPYAPGGTTDYAARLIAQKLTEETKNSFVVENKSGASGTIATELVAKAPPDGYTLLTNDTTYAMLPSLFKRLPWDHATGLVPVTTLAVTPVVLVVPADSAFQNLQQLIDYARKNPGKLNFGSGGTGSSTHLAGEVFKKDGKLFLTHIPYKGAGDAMLGLMSHQVDILITASPTAMNQVNSGKIRALAVTGDTRLSGMPNVPTFKEAGLPEYTVTNWFGLAAPKGTPPDVVNKLYTLVKTALADKNINERLAQVGAQPGGMPPQAFSAFVQQQTTMWSAVARASGVKPD
jgi:tripartite-type tricarboxylate transporter receptor subunit TctC